MGEPAKWVMEIENLHSRWELEVRAETRADGRVLQQLMSDLRESLVINSKVFADVEAFQDALTECDNANRVNMNAMDGGTNRELLISHGNSAFQRLTEDLLPQLKAAIGKIEEDKDKDKAQGAPPPTVVQNNYSLSGVSNSNIALHSPGAQQSIKQGASGTEIAAILREAIAALPGPDLPDEVAGKVASLLENAAEAAEEADGPPDIQFIGGSVQRALARLAGFLHTLRRLWPILLPLAVLLGIDRASWVST